MYKRIFLSLVLGLAFGLIGGYILIWFLSLFTYMPGELRVIGMIISIFSSIIIGLLISLIIEVHDTQYQD